MRHLMTMLLLLAPAFAPAADAPFERTFPVRVSVTADGAVSGVEFKEGLPAPVEAVARAAATELAFEPATVDGVPAASRTTLHVAMRFTPGADGALAVEVASIARAKPYLSPPRYPPDAIRAGLSALVWLRIELGPLGEVDLARSSVESVDVRYASGQKVVRARTHKPFVDAALASAQAWVGAPEEVAGAPLATTLRVPVLFCMPQDSEACRQLTALRADPRLEPREAGVRFATIKAEADDDA